MSHALTSDAAAPMRAATSSWSLSRLLDHLMSLSLAGIVVVVVLQVCGRLAGHPFAWTEELTRALFIWMVFTGMASSMRRADAARVTVMLGGLGRCRQRVALGAYLAGCLLFFALMAWTGAALVRQQLAMHETIATLGWPSWLIGAVVPLAAVLATACTLASLKDRRALIVADEEAP